MFLFVNRHIANWQRGGNYEEQKESYPERTASVASQKGADGILHHGIS